MRNAEFSYVRPGTPRFYFEGITFAIQEGAKFVNAHDEAFMQRYEPEWGDEADVPRIARALGGAPPTIELVPDPTQTPIRFHSDPHPLAAALGIAVPRPFEQGVRAYGREAGWVADGGRA